MKRANLNVIVKRSDIEPIVLYYAFVAEEESDDTLRAPLLRWLSTNSFDDTGFSSWVKESFTHVGEEANIVKLAYPVIYYDLAGFRVPYSFVFDANHEEALIWHWDQRMFRGTLKEALRYLQTEQRAVAASKVA